ncbi:SDR family NAD(P)-dependent oxidoreductase [Parafrankia colletiae]|uniref:SDR family NAD(P)-dependent oxidoreductase n=1 Tax=Parafrankia colletiae TaxID=573497 RepID=UPI000A74E9A9|nr:SDR family NAD(P)-dependent oxidoreductase [Parafrankia colletiae]
MTDQGRDVVVVTGGASGFGLALAERCAASAMDVALLDIDGERVAAEAETLAGAHPVRVEGRRVDVTSEADLTATAGQVDVLFGRCDLLFVNVGVQHFGAVERLTDDDWRWVLDVNVVGAARTVRAFLPLLRRSGHGRIAFTASVNVLAPAARLGVYQASKAAVVALAETLRFELAEDSIQVSVILPAGMTTRHLESSLAARPDHLPNGDGSSDDDRKAMMASRPMSDADVTTAEVAARHALAEVLAGEPYVITHGDLAEAVAGQQAAISRALERMHAATDGATHGATPNGGAGARPPAEVLADIEAVRQLKARYFRTLDTKDWNGFRQVFADDVVIDTTASGGSVVTGADAFLEFVRAALADVLTVHHGHSPEITVSSPSSASGTWAMADHLRFADGNELTGFGHYRETYEKSDGTWRIRTSTLTRLRMDGSFTPPAPS